MACTCIEIVNEKLAERNTRLTQAIVFGKCAHPGLMLETSQIKSGRGQPKAVSMFLTFCPFCGEKYEEEAA